MKIHCVGGGPAGLYFSILAKTADPRHDVTVFERNRLHDTEGWGVVFSGRACDDLARSDGETWREVTAELVAWDTIEVRARGKRLHTSGHAFCGIERDLFISILHRRASALGVQVRFEEPVDDPEPLRDCDLLLGADGFTSACRRRWQQAFVPSHELGASRYIWLGTRRRFETFTFAFRENAHGVFQVHAYPFSRTMSTFIVECHEDTWRRAGLDRAGEAYSAAYCEELFADLLEQNRLLSNRSHWIRFDTLRNERWHHENVVLLGDAAHTAHFSIGSGTKLALEDAVALAGAIRAHDDVPAALAAYQAVRKPRVERVQAAAAHSRRWFETTDARMRVSQSALAFSLMARVPKLGRDALAARDARFVETVEHCFASAHGADAGTPPEEVPAWLGPLHTAGRIAGASRDSALRFVRFVEGIVPPAGAPSVARIDRADHRDAAAIVAAATAAAEAGFPAVELWMSPDDDPGPQLELLARVREATAGLPVIARWDSSDGIALARSLARAGVTALHVPADNAELLRLETTLPVIAIAPHWTLDEIRTALLAERADLVSD